MKQIIKKVTSGKYSGYWMVNFTWSGEKLTGMFTDKNKATKHVQLIRESKEGKLG